MRTENLILSSVILENIPCLWEKHDILIFFIDLDNYNALSAEYLSSIEKENLEKLQTSYFKKRFIVSRTVLKHILCTLLRLDSALSISTYKDRYGKVHITDHEDLCICISYSENIIALAVSKVKIGIDVETRRLLELKNTLKYLHNERIYSDKPVTLYPDKSVTDNDFLKTWTLKEAFSKFSNKSMFFFLNKEPDFNNASYSHFLLDEKYIFSIVVESDRHTISMSHLEKFI
ncbi:hypothetical protein RSJ42_12135 [Methanosarcina hadiensis]|uniref:4'-phosphopantetheinyl transferase family protein n=1 Tax=Methanosarcina hadiensis TaxID=3078083 RepID=UPI003977BBE8